MSDETPSPEFLRDSRFLILDRDPLYTKAFREILKSAGVDVVRLPARSPNLNAFAERFVLSGRRECLTRIIPLGEDHLRSVLREYVAHYHLERNHQGVGNVLLDQGSPLLANDNGKIRRKKRQGGLLSYYHRAA